MKYGKIPSATMRWFFGIQVALLTLCLAAPALAGGRVVWKKTTIEENEKRESWHLEMELHMNRAPDVAYVPMKFEFELLAVYERSLVDGKEEPVETTQQLSNQQPLIESADVGFLDAGSGQIMARTKFSFKVTRAHDFQAGEYRVTIRDTRDGSVVGNKTTLKFKGKNPVVDRRSIVFTGSSKKKKEEKAEEEKTEEEPAEEESDDDMPPPAEEGDAPPPVEERPGGGCHIGSGPAGQGGSMGAALLLLGAGWAIRRRKVAGPALP
jgi:MYXO-CTERM domain-containing protein